MRTEQTGGRHILHVFSRFELFTKGGGVERYIHCVAVRTAAAGYTVTVAARCVDTAPVPQGYAVIATGLRRLWRAIGQADVVHIHGPRTWFSALAGSLALLRGRPFVYTVHCFYRGKTQWEATRKHWWDRSVEALLFRRARAVIVLSDYWQEFIAGEGLRPQRCVVLPNGIDVRALGAEDGPAATLDGNPAMLSVSRLDPVKRIDDAIMALVQPGMAEAQLHIVGHGDDEGRLRAIAGQAGVTSRVVFHHFKSDADVAAMARGADVFVIASAEEGMPTTILEMLARGVPVVASEIPGNLSIMRRLENDATYPLGDVPSLAAQVLATRRPLPPQTTDRLLAQFDWDAIVRRILTLYESI